MSKALQCHISERLRESMEARIAKLLRTDQEAIATLSSNLSLIDLLNGIFLLEGQAETIGAYAAAVKFIVDLVGRDEAWRRSERLQPEELPVGTDSVN